MASIFNSLLDKLKDISFNSYDMGIDLGTASILVYIKGKGIVVKEPSIAAVEKETGAIKAIGERAYDLLGRAPKGIVALRPLRQGVISDFTITEKMIKYFIEKAMGTNNFIKPRVCVCVPGDITEVEKKAVIDATELAGARSVVLIEEPLAAAIGAGIDISKPYGTMIVDIGGGTTDIAVISLGGIVVKRSIKIAGDNFNEAIVRMVKKEYGLDIGIRTAELLKINIGTCLPLEKEYVYKVQGRNMITSLPDSSMVSSNSIYMALKEPVDNIVEEIIKVLEKTPPELASDILDRNIILTGGGAKIKGLDKLIYRKTGIKAILCNNAENAVAIGTGKYVEIINAL